MTYTEITDPEFKCVVSASCPGVFRSEDGKTYQIRGNLVNQIEPIFFSGKGYEGEVTIEISSDLLLSALRGEKLGVRLATEPVAISHRAEEGALHTSTELAAEVEAFGTKNWSVTVSALGEEIVTIEPDCLSGRDIGDEETKAIYTSALHLLAFIGNPHLRASAAELSAANARIAELEKALERIIEGKEVRVGSTTEMWDWEMVEVENIARSALSALAPEGENLCQADAEQVEAHHRTQERPLQSTSEVETIREENKSLKNTLEAAMNVVEFYANPENYFAIGFLPDRPSGAFADDFSDDYGHDHMQGYRPGKMARAFMHKSDWSFGPLDFDPIDPEKLTAPSQIEEPKQSEGDDAELQANSLPDTNNPTESIQ